MVTVVSEWPSGDGGDEDEGSDDDDKPRSYPRRFLPEYAHMFTPCSVAAGNRIVRVMVTV